MPPEETNDSGVPNNIIPDDVSGLPSTGQPVETASETSGEVSPEASGANVETPVEESAAAQALAAFEQFKNTGHLSSGQTANPLELPQGMRPSRVFDGLEPQEKAMFQKMSNDAYNHLYPFYIKAKNWEKELADLKRQNTELSSVTSFDRDGAWKLTPEYEQTSSLLNQYTGEVAHWREQLTNIRAGRPWQPIVQDQDGNPVLGQVMAAPEDPGERAQWETTIQSALMEAHNLKAHASAKFRDLESGYKTKHTNFVQTLQGVESKIFAGADTKKLDEAAKTKLSLFPEYTHSQPAFKMLAKALVLIDGLLAMQKQTRGQNISAQIKNRTAAAAGPAGATITQTGRSGSPTVGSVIDEFKAARAAGVA